MWNDQHIYYQGLKPGSFIHFSWDEGMAVGEYEPELSGVQR